MIAPPVLEQEPVSSAPPVTLAQGPADQWARRIFVLEQMLSRAYGNKARAPGELTDLLDEANRLMRIVVNMRNDGFRAQEALEHIEHKGREKRAQLGFAVDQLGVDSSKAKKDPRPPRGLKARPEGGSKGARTRYEAAHKEAMYWEGRAGFHEPSTDLANAYRMLADSVDEWLAFRQEERRSDEYAEAAERTANDIDFQVRELREVLKKQEHELDGERAKCEERIQTLGKEAEREPAAHAEKRNARETAPPRLRV